MNGDGVRRPLARTGTAFADPFGLAMTKPDRSLDETLDAASIDPASFDRSSSGSSEPETQESTGVARALVGGRYEVLGLLGAGGMGTVYKVRDTELDETVALKMLRRDLIDSPAMLERFRREAKLARRVTHVNVARTFDIGEHAGERFLTMEFVDGEPLSAVMARKGRLPLARVLEIVSGICAGLSAAHAAGVVHRDLKPENVMLCKSGRVVITDFGVARAHAESIGAMKTIGGVVGTPAYMAPEQVEGAPDVDARADVFALGVLLFELLTGEAPWQGSSAFAVAAARLSGDAPDPRVYSRDIPAALAEVTRRAMARRREQRYGSAEEFASALSAAAPTISATALKAPATTPPSSAPRIEAARSTTSGEKTVAVLPFRNAGPPEDDYVADGLTEDLIDTLSVARGLKVRPRGVVMPYKGKDVDPRAIGGELGVQVVVEGSLRRAGDKVRINARVTSVADGFQLWAKRFERRAADLLVVSDEVAHAITEALSIDLEAKAREAPSDPVAIDLYLRARQEFNRLTPDAMRGAVELFKQAEEHAPGDATILSGYARALARLWFFASDPTAELAKQARMIAERAVRVAPDRGEPLLALASVHYAEGDIVGAARHLRKALAKAPLLADAQALLADILGEVGRPEDALARHRTAAAIDPQLKLYANIARIHALLGQWDEVAKIFEEASTEAERRIPLVMLSARLALWAPDPLKAIERVPDMSRLPQIEPVKYAGLLLDVVRRGKLDDEERVLLNRALATTGEAPRLLSLKRQFGTELFAYVGDVDEAFEHLRHGVEAGLIDISWLDRCPLLAPLRNDVRFQAARSVVQDRAARVLDALGLSSSS